MNPRVKTPLLLCLATVAGLLLYGLHHQSDRLAGAIAEADGQITALFGLHTGLREEVSERIINLPEDGQVWSAVFVWPSNREADPDSRRLAAAFATEPRLQSLLAQTKVHHYTPEDPLFRERYAAAMGTGTPQFWLVKPEENPAHGQTIYAVAGGAIPSSGKAMADTIAGAIKRLCPRPKPDPTPTVTVTPPAPQIPTIDEPEPGPQPDIPLWAWILPIVAAGAGAIHEWRRST